VQATRVADVAERAGVTVGTVYRYFADKDALIEAALQLPPRPRAQQERAGARPGTALPQLADAVRRWSNFFRDDGARSVRVALSDPRRGTNGMAGVGEAVREVSAIIREGAARGDVRDDLEADAAAQVIVSAIAANAVLAAPDHADAAPDGRVTDVIVALITRGLRADGPSWRS
jgi:AcrR family transcriptional regulator